MFYNHRELKRVWRVKTFIGDKEVPNPKIQEETVVAWNQVDAIRASGREVAEPPEPLFFVTWPDADENIYRVDDVGVGPVGNPVKTSIAPVELSEGDWQ